MSRPTMKPSYICARCLRKPTRTFSTSRRVQSGQYTPLPSRTVVSVSGEAAPKFLQGLTTNNIDPSRTTGWYTAFLNAQGRVLYDAFIYPSFSGEAAGEATYYIEVDKGEAKGFVQHLKRHKLRTKIKIQDRSGEIDVYAAWGGEAAETTAAAPSTTAQPQTLTLTDPRLPNFGTRTLHPSAHALPAQLSALAHAQPEAYTLHRYAHGVPEGPADIPPGAALPQESNMDHLGAIDFRKGCYLGQELTIRTQHTGVVRKRVLPVQLYADGAAAPSTLAFDASGAPGLPPPGAEIKAVGAKRGCGRFLSGVGNVGLALCRLESMTDLRVSAEGGPYQEGMEFLVGGVKVKAFVPPWLREAERRKGEKRRVPVD